MVSLSLKNINKKLKLLFIICALVFVISLVTENKTNCQACELEYDGEIIDGYEAFNIFEEACISYSQPGTFNNEPVYIDIDCINSTTNEDGMQLIDINQECAGK